MLRLTIILFALPVGKLGYEVSNAHRALADCYLTWQLYQKLNEM